MKIIKTNDIEKSSEILKNKIEKTKDSKTSSTNKNTDTNIDVVDISKESEILYKAKKEIEKLPDIRTEKVEEIKNKIEKNEYKVDEGKIADKILEENIIDKLV